MSNILVTGGSGFVGSNVVKDLVAAGHTVQYTYRTKEITDTAATGLQIDLADLNSFQSGTTQRLTDVTHLVHAAARLSHNRDDILADLQEQVLDSVSTFRNLMSHLPKLQKIVFISSCSAALSETDTTFYGPAKLLMEDIVRPVANSKGIDYVCLRFPQLYGPGEPHSIFISSILEKIRAGDIIRLENNGAVQKDVLYIDDAVGSIGQALQEEASGLFTITDSRAYTIREILDELALTTGKTPLVENISVSDSEIARKSFHCESNAADLGYRIRYNMAAGITALVRAAEG